MTHDDLPPLDDDLIAEPPDSRWPTVIGTISIVYAILGMCLHTCAVSMTLLGEFFASLGGMDLVIPTSLKIVNSLASAVGLFLGIVLISAGIAVVRRRRHGVRRLKTWAVLRILLIIVGLGVGIAFMPANLELQERMLEMQAEQMRDAGRADLVPEWDEEKAARNGLISAGVMSVGFAIYPLFLGFYLSRRQITEETQLW